MISNGYDEDDFKGINPSKPEIFTISYIGTLPDSYPLNGFLNALKILIASGRDFRLRFIGFVSSGQRDLIASALEKSKVEYIKYVDHRSAIRYMLDSSALLLIIPDHAAAAA